MKQKEMQIQVFCVPGGEGASLLAYEQLVDLLEAHEDLFLSIYRGCNSADGTWLLVLIGEKSAFSRYQKPMRQMLSDVNALPLVVPPESLAPFVERFLARQAEMLRKKETFIKKHYSLRQKHEGKKQGRRSKGRKKQK